MLSVHTKLFGPLYKFSKGHGAKFVLGSPVKVENMNSFDNPGEGDQNNPRQAEIEQKKLDIACYKHSLELNRIALSKTIWDIRNYCFTNAQNDPLLCPPRDNPYKSQRSCTVI
ncbi:unnamed protein product [Schistosoma bovis]|uniref:G protein gamma domain-containing protein n=2 Tax=Schistosoma TaxID=6181 RepID=A0A922LQK3_SCHHA|nr:hypothetical protein MS3_00001182 [Schistosoma haematobium]CAH8628991.1 unnamed protein product [Schistosoma mattheei]CAH8656836.1 unnamed protein product [Schistosoma curassoni]CAH8658809.1 unnamed protein product [Schistosoma bovis]KAH9591509.1 hypothetical protein MS3_00001182 [Schistosoma haematobium]CAH8663542.1 unnamed protein product [Schistosoma bovis]